MAGDEDGRADIPPEDLSLLRGMLASSLPSVNVGPMDKDFSVPVVPKRRRKVRFLEKQTILEDAGAPTADSKQSRPSSAKDISHADREERLRVLKEKQNEERQRKLDELKNQALAAQKFREQKEEERRKRMEELRTRDTDRRHQVEERKRQIWEADKERREAILRKNQEREAKIESKRKNERSSMIFAFGSSTPRMLEPGDTVPYWSTRRATSTTNVMTMSLSAATPGPLTRRSSERELDGSKKRATSAGGIERKPHLDDPDSLQLGTGWRKDAARRKTDLTPTIPLKELNRTSLGKKSSPGRAFSMSRLDILAAPRRPKIAPLPELQPIQQTNKKNTTYKSMSVLPGSDKGSKGATVKGAKSMLHLGPTPPPRLTRAEKLRKKAREMAKSSESSGPRSGEQTPSRPLSSMSQHSVASNLSSASASLRSRSSLTTRRPRPISIAVTGVTSDKNLDKSMKSPSGMDRPPIPKVHSATKKTTPKPENVPKKTQEKLKSGKSSTLSSPSITPIESPIIEIAEPSPLITQDEIKIDIEKKPKDKPIEIKEESVPKTEKSVPKEDDSVSNAQIDDKKSGVIETKVIENGTDLSECDMTASMISKTRITTEEEAKAALAERRRLAREQVEREAELERQRLENERIAEEERIRKEEEDQRRMEEEQLRLLEEARKAEEIRLQEAIEEAKKRDEEERKRKEEELRLKIEKEEADKKAKEEAEKMRIEMEIRLKKEEEDRQARRKRVEAIMSRTRASKGSLNATPSKDGEDDDISPPDGIKKTPDSVGSEIDQFIESERSHSDANTTVSNNKHNGNHQNGSYNSINENNVTNTRLLDLSEDEVRILDLDTGKIVPEQPQFIPYQDKKEPPTVNDLLS